MAMFDLWEADDTDCLHSCWRVAREGKQKRLMVDVVLRFEVESIPADCSVSERSQTMPFAVDGGMAHSDYEIVLVELIED